MVRTGRYRLAAMKARRSHGYSDACRWKIAETPGALRHHDPITEKADRSSACAMPNDPKPAITAAIARRNHRRRARLATYLNQAAMTRTFGSVPAPKAAITSAPCNGSAVASAPIRATYTMPQGSQPQRSPSANALAGVLTGRNHRDQG